MNVHEYSYKFFDEYIAHENFISFGSCVVFISSGSCLVQIPVHGLKLY